MVVCGVKSSSFGLIFLLISVLKLCGFSETSREYENSCSADIYKSRFRFCPKGRRSMADMGNNFGQFVCGAKGKESSNKADESPTEMLPASKSKEEDDTEKQRKILPGHEFRSTVEKSSCGEKGKESSTEADESPAEMLPESKSKEEDGTETQGKILLGHAFREVDGKHVLLDVNTGRNFEFDVFDGNRAKNQRRYEDLGEAITEYVYVYLEKHLGLEKVTIPVGAKKKDPKGFFFMSKDALKAEKLMILIHGSGVVRAGQWARSLIINDSFETGTMVPYIKRAIKERYGVLITNGNHNYDEEKRKRIKDSESPQEHFVYVWKKFIKDAMAKDIVIVAHSFGGVVVQHCVRNIKEAMERIKAVAFTDSVHSVGYRESSQIKRWFKEKTRNWISSYEDLDTSIYGDDSGVVSAGTTEHVWTSHCAKESVFKFFKEKLAGGEKSGEDNMENKDNNKNERTKHTAKDNAKGQENTKGAPKKTNTRQKCKGKCGKRSGCGDDEKEKNNQEGSEPDERQLEKGSKEGETEAKEQNQHEEDMGSGGGSGLVDTEGGTEKDETVRLTTGENENTVLEDKKEGEKAENAEQENKDQDTGGEGSATGTPGEKDKLDEKGGLTTEDNLHAQCDEKEKKKALDNAGERKKGNEDMDTGGDGPATGKPGEKAKLDEKGGLKAEENLDRKVEDEQGNEQGDEKPQETNQEKFATDGYPMEVDEEGGGDGGGDVEMEETS